MIEEIIMNGVASYAQPITINDLKKFNLFYGLNGVGKTVLSQYLANYNEPSEKFKQCSIRFSEKTNDTEVLVYNQSFIDKNFLEDTQQKCIFTLDKDNIDAEKAIGIAQKEIERLNLIKIPLDEKIQNLMGDQDRLKNDLKDIIWKEKQTYENTSLKRCLEGRLSSKDSFLEKILNTIPFNIEENKIPEILENFQGEMEKLANENIQKKSLHNLLNYNLESFENNEIFQFKIIGSQDSYLSELVAKLNHADWITQGITDYLDHGDDCPFCKREMNSDLKEMIRSYINRTYQDKLSDLKDLKNQYRQYTIEIAQILDQISESDLLSNNKDLKLYIEELRTNLKGNFDLIEKKINEPSQPITLHPTLEAIHNINTVLNLENEKVTEFNQKLDNRKKEIENIIIKFWEILRKKHNTLIEKYDHNIRRNRNEFSESNKKINLLTENINTQKEIINENLKMTKNIDIAIQNINSRLRSFGLEGFQIIKVNTDQDDGHFYEIVRNSPSSNADTGTFKTLSEGEKTLITFLYFIEICCGTHSNEKAGNIANRIIVIDDPISSLSFNLVFDIATLIKNIFFKLDTKYKQVLILTHHLYFFYEFYSEYESKFKNKTKCYRVTKYQNTDIIDLNTKEIKNNYACYWQVIKDIQAHQIASVLLPNAMRNILEHYLAFMGEKEKLSTALGILGDIHKEPAYKSFDRYINRESHSDSSNLSDSQDIDVDKFISYFKAIFEQIDGIKHYEKMMGE